MIKYLKTRWKTGVLALLMVAVTAGILFLYDIPLEPVGYVAVFEMLLTGLGLMWDYHKYRKKQESLLYIRDCGNFSEEYLEAPENENEAIYREICRSLDEKRIEAENQRSAFGTELTDFYTLWVHQIKTPIAAARLLLQEATGDNDARVLFCRSTAGFPRQRNLAITAYQKANASKLVFDRITIF